MYSMTLWHIQIFAPFNALISKTILLE